jgi:hypothetical protein
MAVGNLEFIKSVEVTSSVSSIDVDNVFTDDYDVYFVTITGFSTTSTIQTSLNLRYINNSGVVSSSATYDRANLFLNTQSAFSEDRATNETSHKFAPFDLTPENGNVAFYIYNPFDSSSYTFLNFQMASSRAAHFLGVKGIGVQKNAEAHRGFQILEELARPFDEGQINVYGVQ